MDDKTNKPPIARLPTTVTEWYDARKGSLTKTDNDRVEELHLKLIGNADYLRYLEAYDDSESVEGSMATDNVFAAQMIRNKAIEIGEPRISRLKIRTIIRCMNVVLRRYRFSRKERANMIGGVVVMPEKNGDED
jgi:hypothetical protein